MSPVWYPGDRFPNGWEIRKIIDSGGMGTVYIVTHPQHKLPLVAKTFKQHLFSSSAALQRFHREAEQWVLLGRHPYIVEAKYVLEIEGKPFVFVEYVPGSSLRELLWKRLDLHRALQLAIRICDGMAYVHSAKLTDTRTGLIHCDIKPENILIAEKDKPKVTDFGLARTPSADEEAKPGITGSWDRATAFQTKAGTIMGTPLYMSPEHFSGVSKVNKLSDVYSFGVVLFEMLTGHVPFHPESRSLPLALAYLEDQHRKTQPQTPSSLNPNIPQTLEAIVLASLEKVPAARPAGFKELRDALQDVHVDLFGVPVELARSADPSELEIAENRARTYLNLGDYQQAMTWADRALGLAPRSALIWSLKGLMWKGLENYEEATRCFEQALQLTSDPAEAWGNLGTAHWAAERFDQAMECYNKTLQLDPESFPTLQNKGVLLDTLGSHEEALVCFDRALRINPRHANSWASKGNVLTKLGRYEEALKCERIALGINPRDPNAINNMAILSLRMGRFDEALAWSDRLIEVDPRYTYSWYNKAVVLIKMKQYDEAIRVLDEGLKVSSIPVKMLESKLAIAREIAEIRRRPEDYQRVYACVEEILRLDPKHESALSFKTEMASLAPAPRPMPVQPAGHCEELVAIAKKLLSEGSDASDGKMLNLAGEALLNFKRDIEASLAFFRCAIEIEPKLMDSYNNIGVALGMQGDIEGAIQYYDKAIELAPDFHMPWNNKGNCLADLGDLSAALACWNRAIELNPNFAITWSSKGLALLRLGAVNDALSAFNHALALDPSNPVATRGKQLCMMQSDGAERSLEDLLSADPPSPHGRVANWLRRTVTKRR